jgi:hypothetical protein
LEQCQGSCEGILIERSFANAAQSQNRGIEKKRNSDSSRSPCASIGNKYCLDTYIPLQGMSSQSALTISAIAALHVSSKFYISVSTVCFQSRPCCSFQPLLHPTSLVSIATCMNVMTSIRRGAFSFSRTTSFKCVMTCISLCCNLDHSTWRASNLGTSLALPCAFVCNITR